MKTFLSLIAIGLGLALLMLALPIIPVCRDWAFVDKNTGSRMGYRKWIFGLRTASWYRESSLATFMISKCPMEFQQQWVSYAGTGRNIYGEAMFYGHGRPGMILHLDLDVLDEYCAQASDAEKRRLCDVFSHAVPSEIEKVRNHIYESVIEARDKKAGQVEK